jgi:hypothetical protein
MTSLFITCCFVVLWVSTVGASPVTVMLSFTSPTRRSTLSVVTCSPASWTFSRLIGVKPVSVKLTV